jgi:hypothetical protein
MVFLWFIARLTQREAELFRAMDAPKNAIARHAPGDLHISKRNQSKR